MFPVDEPLICSGLGVFRKDYSDLELPRDDLGVWSYIALIRVCVIRSG